MIKELKISNFYSINKTQAISFEISKKDMLDNSSFMSPCGNMLNSIAVIIGNNASGKTNILKGLSFLGWFVEASYQDLKIDQKIPVTTHKLSEDKNSSFELIFEEGGKEYQYKITLNPDEVVHEFLGVKKERGYSYLYEINRSNGKVSYDKWNLSKLNDDDKARFEQRLNASLFSFLLSTGHLPATGIKRFMNLKTNLWQLGRMSKDALSMVLELSKHFDSEDRRQLILKYLKEFGFGIDDFELGNSYIELEKEDTANDRIQKVKVNMLNLVHKTNDKDFTLSFLDESNGTQEVIYLLNKMIPILEKGGILIYDEIESSIHPYIIRKLINLLGNEETNPNRAQLIFSTHQPWLLDDRTKTQIYLTEQNKQMETEIYRLDEVEGIRNDDNFCSKYLSGAYGGVADMRWF
ncbi:MAG: AAA family ATPase [Alphaproteobacteria bacterium]|nr:AAA family ATPase [Alphaproteobacteria bacterium]